MDPRTTAEGELMYVDPAAPERGSEAPFLPAFRDERGDRRYGWYCVACESVDTAMDTMGRVECNRCGNRRKPDGWDAAHE